MMIMMIYIYCDGYSCKDIVSSRRVCVCVCSPSLCTCMCVIMITAVKNIISGRHTLGKINRKGLPFVVVSVSGAGAGVAGASVCSVTDNAFVKVIIP